LRLNKKKEKEKKHPKEGKLKEQLSEYNDT